AGNKRATQTIEAAGRAGVIGKPRGLAPGSIKPKPKLTTIGAKLAARDKAAGRGDTASVNISFGGARGKRLDAEISRNVKAQAIASRKADKARNIEQKAKWSAAKAARDADKPKRIRSAESLRISRAKKIEARRMQKIDVLPISTVAKRARNSARTQAKALAFYKAPGSIKPKAAAAQADQPGRIQNVPGKDLKRYRMLQGAKIRQRKIADEAGARMGYTNTRPWDAEKLYNKSDLAMRRARRADATQRRLSGATGKGEAPKPVPNWHFGEKDKFRGGVGYLKRRGASSLRSEGQIGRVKVERYGAQRPGVIRKPKVTATPPPAAPLPSGRTVFRSRSEAIRAQRGRAVVTLKAGNLATPSRRGTNQHVSVLMKDGYGVRRPTVSRKSYSQSGKYLGTNSVISMGSKPLGAKEVAIPVRPGKGARISGRTIATQPSLLGGPAKALKVYRKAPKAKGRR
ncbi:MAG: hypothetical protein ACRC2L_08115, partial [Serratia nevei]